jgi:hypothetical protein
MKRRIGNATRVSGVLYRSAFEASVARDLEKRGIGFEYESENFEYAVPHLYYPDFSLTFHSFAVEAKGYMPAADRKKLLAVKEAYPDLDLRLLFQRASTKLSRATNSMTYGQWATRHGFTWAEGTIPEEWLDCG